MTRDEALALHRELEEMLARGPGALDTLWVAGEIEDPAVIEAEDREILGGDSDDRERG